MNQRQTFKKEERLRSKKLIDELFQNGKSFVVQPFKIFYLINSEYQTYPAQVLVTVAKKNIKRAVDRNLLKRRTKEAYRINKSHLYSHLQKADRKIILGIVYYNSEISEYRAIEESIRKMILRIEREI